MTFQAYIDNIRAKTGMNPSDFAKLANERGLTRHAQIVDWLKEDFGLGHGHAAAIAGVILRSGQPRADADQKLDALFSGKKSLWRGPADALLARVLHFGDDVRVAAGGTYLSLLRGDKKFGIVQPASPARLDIGIKLKSRMAEGRFEAAGAWNTMVSHRVRVGDPAEIDSELMAWLNSAYTAIDH